MSCCIDHQGPVLLKGLSFGHKLVQLTHLVPKDKMAKNAFHKQAYLNAQVRCRSLLHTVPYFKHAYKYMYIYFGFDIIKCGGSDIISTH